MRMSGNWNSIRHRSSTRTRVLDDTLVVEVVGVEGQDTRDVNCSRNFHRTSPFDCGGRFHLLPRTSFLLGLVESNLHHHQNFHCCCHHKGRDMRVVGSGTCYVSMGVQGSNLELDNCDRTAPDDFRCMSSPGHRCYNCYWGGCSTNRGRSPDLCRRSHPSLKGGLVDIYLAAGYCRNSRHHWGTLMVRSRRRGSLDDTNATDTGRRLRWPEDNVQLLGIGCASMDGMLWGNWGWM